MTESPYPKYPVMLIDDEEQALKSFEMALRSTGINNVICCHDSREVMPLLQSRDVEVILLDLRMPNISGEELLTNIVGDYPEVPVIVVTGAIDVETAVKCMRQGAFDYIVKPVEKSRLVSATKHAVEIRVLYRENQRLKTHVLSNKFENPKAFSKIVTNSISMRSIFHYVESIAGSAKPILITGENGVGKELIARVVHHLNQRDGYFVSVNVTGLDDTVITDMLFGHIKGAITGTSESIIGLVERAAGGTLFLEGIEDLSSAVQATLLRLIMEREYVPLGSVLAKHSDAHIILATNKNLDALQSSGKFRKDLFYRICHHHFTIPPLRDRLEDLPVLVKHFLEKACKNLKIKKTSVPEELIPMLSTYHFPGNVRELKSMIIEAISSHETGKLSLGFIKSHISQKGFESQQEVF